MPRIDDWRGGAVAAVLTLGIAVASVSGREPDQTGPPRDEAAPTKLAVLPLQATSPHAATDHLGVALGHEIAWRLMGIRGLVVRSPGIVRKYRDVTIDHLRIAREIDVAFVLTGRYVVRGDRLEVTARLIDVARAATVWEGPFDVGLDELPVLTAVVSGRVVEALGVEPSERGGERLQAVATADRQAYDVYLLAISSDPKTADDWIARSERLEGAVALAPAFASAVAELGNAYLQHASLVGGRGQSYAQAEDALRRALRLDPERPRILQLVASLDAKIGKSEESAEVLQRARQLYPSAPAFHAGLGYIYRYAGLMDESIAAYRRAQTLDASLASLVSTEGQITKSLIYAGTYQDALASQLAVNRYLAELGRPRDEKQLFYEGMIHYYANERPKAFALFDASWAADDRSVWSTFAQAYKAAAEGDVARVRAITDQLESRNVVDGERRYRLVHFHALIGQRDAALRHLETAIESGFFNAPYIATDPLLANLRETPEFGRLLERAEIRHAAFARRFGGKARTN